MLEDKIKAVQGNPLAVYRMIWRFVYILPDIREAEFSEGAACIQNIKSRELYLSLCNMQMIRIPI